MGLFKKGNISLKVEKNKYKPGENVRGDIKLDVNKPVKARKLEIKLQGIRTDDSKRGATGLYLDTTDRKTDVGGHHITKVYDSKKTIDGKKEYLDNNYSFEIEIPSNIHELAKLPQEEFIKETQEMMLKKKSIIKSHETNINWYIIAQLDVPLGKDIKEKKQIERSK